METGCPDSRPPGLSPTLPGPWATSDRSDHRHPLFVQPYIQLSRIETDEASDLEEWNSSLGDKSLDVSWRDVQYVSQVVNVDQSSHGRCCSGRVLHGFGC
jgi:hypothetical protein